MDRYEYKELIDRVRGLIDRKDMEEAARQLDANNWQGAERQRADEGGGTV